MPTNARIMVICDDVRQELGNKLTIVGTYNDDMIFPPGEGAFGLPKLAAVFVITGLRGVGQVKYRSYMKLPGAAAGQVPPFSTMPRPHPESDEHNFVFHQVPAVFLGPGALTARLELEEPGGQVRTFEVSVNVQRGTSQIAGPDDGLN